MPEDDAAQALSDVPITQVPVLSQQPGQLFTLQLPLPPVEHCPPLHVPPLWVQSWQAAPAAPHAVSCSAVTH